MLSLLHCAPLWLCSTGADPTTDPTTLGSVAKVVGLCEKRRENAESVMKSPTGRYSYRQDVMSIRTRCRIGDVFYMASRKNSTTSPKPLTDKPDHKQTSHKDRQAGSMFPTLPDRIDCFCASVSIIGILVTLYNPPPPPPPL